jgi:hypothetical protein
MKNLSSTAVQKKFYANNSSNPYTKPLVLHKGEREYKIVYEELEPIKVKYEDWYKKMRDVPSTHVMKNPYPESKTILDGIFYGLFLIACGIALGLIVSAI